jgi:TonB family protein
MLALPLLAVLGCQVLSDAHGGPPIVLNLDTAAPEASSTESRPWPQETRVDTKNGSLHLLWNAEEVDPEEEVIGIDEILQFEHARNFDHHPEELFVHLVGGRRILISRGEEVRTDLAQLQAWIDRPAITLPSGEGHLEWDGSLELAPPRLVIETRGGAFEIQMLDESSIPDDSHIGPTSTAAGTSPPSKGTGTVKRENIDHTIKSHMTRFRSCYQRQLQRRPGLKGTVVMEITIRTDGTLRSASVAETSLHDPAVETCLSDELMRLEFAPPRRGEVVVRYPFTFSTS